MDPLPTIQVLEKASYTNQRIVPLPTAPPLHPLAPFSIRFKPTLLFLSTNNFTYARVGNLLAWWDVHPLSPSIPAI
ncbi:hypothetical protein K432DRAFT_381296 [Lepidopterella palustris CBS 459.81]|uniref:Uncharacterized protein n=1 Tax=Lepidopterella palustris CBS 459.81 TaxID=1314670 RepID=A0A8E2JGV6_9PEZI|nr:hypothetical protein K432DRAFT_381296 [Lepidopterella palustris CBS 459.81]